MSILRQIRESHYLSRKMLSDASGVSQSTIVRMEDGGRVTQEAAEKVVSAINDLTGLKLSLSDIKDLKLYNLMRDRRQRSKFKSEEPQLVA